MKAMLRSFRCRLLVLSMVLSALFLGICSKSSPLYPLNDWVDVQCFFTMGRSILDGLVPYRDLYEQKGPVLYFLYALAALISRDSFWGVFLLETVTFGLFLYFSGCIAALYLGKGGRVYGIIAILALVIPISKAFAHGGSCELTSLYLLSYGLYSVLRALQKKRALRFGEAFLNGIFAAFALYIKFTMLGFYLGLAAFVIVWYVSCKYPGKVLLATIGQFLLGMAAVSGLVFGYFALHGAVEDFLTVYFYNNMFLYPTQTEASKLTVIQSCLKSTLQNNLCYSWLLTVGLLLFILRIRKHWQELVMALLTFLGLTVGTYWGGRNSSYYGLILSVYTVFGLIAICEILRLAGVGTPKSMDFPLAKGLAVLCGISVFLSISLNTSQNTYLMRCEKEDHPAYQFAETIASVEDPKILNYGFLDGGFYYAAGIQPSCKFFCTLNINAPDMWDTQRECINSGAVDFVITRKYPLSRYSVNSDLYTLVDETTFYFEGVDFTYYLYQRK